MVTDTRHQHKQSRDELLARYEGGVWTFLIVVGLALFGVVVWMVLQSGRSHRAQSQAVQRLVNSSTSL